MMSIIIFHNALPVYRHYFSTADMTAHPNYYFSYKEYY